MRSVLSRGLLAALVLVAVGGAIWSQLAASRKNRAEQAAIVSIQSLVKAEQDQAATVSPVEHEPVATITGLASAHWTRNQKPRRLLSRCGIGERFVLQAGSAELTFDIGAQVTVFGPADFEITSPTSIRCVTGRVTALVDERGKGFTIRTPQAEVIDLGTQFGLEISKEGETQVVVFQGAVDTAYSPPAAMTGDTPTRRLLQGEALVVKNSGEFERLVSVMRNSFMIGPKDAKWLRPPVISAVRDNIRKPGNLLSYQIVQAGLEDDALSFVDRNHQWNGVAPGGLPEFLVGADYVMPFNNDKFVRDLKLEIDLARPAALYVFLDKNMEVPEWLRMGFVETGAEIGLDGSRTTWHQRHSLAEGAGRSIDFKFSVWRRDVKQAGTVTLGGVNPPEIGTRSSGFNMYGIAAVAAE